MLSLALKIHALKAGLAIASKETPASFRRCLKFSCQWSYGVAFSWSEERVDLSALRVPRIPAWCLLHPWVPLVSFGSSWILITVTVAVQQRGALRPLSVVPLPPCGARWLLRL
jgi:hypothetical protein